MIPLQYRRPVTRFGSRSSSSSRDRRHNWQKVEAESEKEAAEKVCGFALTQTGRLAQLRARVLRFGDLKQRSATDFYSAE